MRFFLICWFRGGTVATNKPTEPASVDRLCNSDGTGDNRTSLCQKESHFARHKSYIHSASTELLLLSLYSAQHCV